MSSAQQGIGGLHVSIGDDATPIIPPVIPVGPLTTEHLYISAANGNDANDGLTPATAVRTQAGFLLVFPRIRFAPVVVHIASGSYANLAFPSSVALNTGCAVYLNGDGAGQPGDNGFVNVATGVAGGGSTDLVVNAAIASKDLWQGMTLRFTSGAIAAAARRHIGHSTTTTFTPAWRLPAVPAAGDAFSIDRPGAIITYADAYTFAAGIGFGQVDSPLVLVNVSAQGPARAAQTPSCVLRIVKCHVVMYGVCTQSGGSWQLVESYANAGTLYSWGSQQQRRVGNVPPLGNGTVTTVASAALADLGTDSFNYQGWGVSSPWASATQTAPLLFDHSSFNGCVCAGYLPVSSGSTCVLTGGGLVANTLGLSGSISLESDANCYIQGNSVQRLVMTGGGGQDAPGNPFWLDSAGTVILLEPGSFLELGDVVSASASGAGTYGIINTGGTIYCTNGNGGTGAIGLSMSGAGIGLLLRQDGRLLQNGGALTITHLAAPTTAIEAHSGGHAVINSLVCNGDLNFGADARLVGLQGAAVTLTARRLVVAGLSEVDFTQVLSATVTLNNGAAGNCCSLDRGARATFFNSVLAWTGTVTLAGNSDMQHGGAIGASLITSSATAMLSIARGSSVSCLGAVSGTLSITSTAAPAVGVQCQGEFSFVNARIAVSGAVSGCDFSRGGRIYSAAQPTAIVGSTNDFIDEQGGFADGLLAAQTCVFTGQHPAGAYSLLAPTGSGFVQRLS